MSVSGKNESSLPTGEKEMYDLNAGKADEGKGDEEDDVMKSEVKVEKSTLEEGKTKQATKAKTGPHKGGRGKAKEPRVHTGSHSDSHAFELPLASVSRIVKRFTAESVLVCVTFMDARKF